MLSLRAQTAVWAQQPLAAPANISLLHAQDARRCLAQEVASRRLRPALAMTAKPLRLQKEMGLTDCEAHQQFMLGTELSAGGDLDLHRDRRLYDEGRFPQRVSGLALRRLADLT